ncbi:MAG: GAF domain-containing protein [Spirochaetes bacterium]|jgi:putative methionine-R-sulfoxide reductase with GAF domain|nr:GAF domain-containing protein [Spirochaetota bacterium]
MAFGSTLHRVDLSTREVTPQINGAVIIRVRMEDTVYPLIRTWPGMGSTGETLLVRKAGDETLFLNPLRFMEDSALRFSVSSDSSKAQPAHYATAGKEGVTTTADYRGVTVIAAYRHLPGIGWGFVAKQDAREALAPVRLLTRQWIVVAVVVVLAAYLAAILLARALTQPLSRLMERATDVERGNFQSGVPVEGPKEVRLLSDAFETMTSAVRDRESQLKAHAEELEVLNDLGRNIAATLELADIANRVVHIVADRFGRHLAVLFLRDEDQEELVAYATAGTRADAVSPLERIAMGRGVIGRAAQERRTQLVSDAKNAAHFQALPKLDTKSEVAVPVLREGRLLGVLVVDSRKRPLPTTIRCFSRRWRRNWHRPLRTPASFETWRPPTTIPSMPWLPPSTRATRRPKVTPDASLRIPLKSRNSWRWTRRTLPRFGAAPFSTTLARSVSPTQYC